MKKFVTTIAATAAAILSPVAVHGRVAFVAPVQSRAKVVISPVIIRPTSSSQGSPSLVPRSQGQKVISTSIGMGYQLPPSGPKGPMDQINAILPNLATGLLVVLFFASPLGGIFFAITNSIFVLALLTPFVLFGGFQLWSSLYTIEAPCPSCGAIPVRALKNGEPSMCLNCGAFSRANEKGDGLELCNNPNDIMGMGSGLGGASSLFDALFGEPGGEGGISDFDVIDGPKKDSPDERAKKAKRQATIIDVDVERE
jgi:hypothetical protein